MTIKEVLKKNRPNLSESSLKTYNSILMNLYKKVLPADAIQVEVKRFNETDKFLNFLKDFDIGRRKSYLSALVVLTNNEKYKTQMMEDGNKFNEKQKLQQKTKKQEDNWVEQDELKEIFLKHKKWAESIYKLKSNKKEYIQDIQNFIILSLVSGFFIPVRRLLDWSEMVVSNTGESKTENYLKINKNKYTFHFNRYKTNNVYGEQIVEVPKELVSILKKWIALLKSVYPQNNHLLVDSVGNKLTPSKLNQRLNKILGKSRSVNALRHSNISEKLKHIPALKELIDDAEANGHNLLTHLEYIKR
jgi:integrase